MTACAELRDVDDSVRVAQVVAEDQPPAEVCQARSIKAGQVGVIEVASDVRGTRRFALTMLARSLSAEVMQPARIGYDVISEDRPRGICRGGIDIGVPKV